MVKDQDIILAVRNQDINFLNKHLHRNNTPPCKLRYKGSTKKLNVNYQDGDGMSALHQAALMGHTEIMEMLLDSGAVVGLKDNKGMTPLHYAAWQGKSEPVRILLQWNSPSSEQANSGETPLHLACQHGHLDVVVELLLQSNLCSQILANCTSDMSENQSTCLHLAAKNGHSDVIRLLLQSGMNINRSTLQGTCLHEAALFGKTDVVKLLLDCGVDVNKVNSYDQTALDIVNKFTTNRASKEIKQLLKEASYCVQAKAIRNHCNIYDPHSLTFKEGDLIKIAEQRQDGMWKGTLMKEGCMAKPGWFPADHVVLYDNSTSRRNQLKTSTSFSLTLPLTPDRSSLAHCNSLSFNGVNTTLSSNHSLFASVGHDEAFPPPPSPTYMSKFQHVRPQGLDGNPQEVTVLPPPPQSSHQNLVNGLQNHSQNGKMIVNHVGEHCYIDSVEPAYQNLCHVRSSSSPSGSNRNSAASSDSGRGLSANYVDPKGHHNYVNVQLTNQYRLSGTSYESGVSSRQSYHSTSSSSVGSLDRLEESGYSSQINVAELFQAGVPDHEVLWAWLKELNYEEYYQNFVQAGYDMPTITHMTPQDLTAIGISKPGHRKKLKAEISRLNIHDGIPDFRPNNLYDWLRMLNLEQYYNTLANQGYDNFDCITDIMWEDLEEIGIQRLGHQKKIMLAIDRLKRILSGSKRLSTLDGQSHDATEELDPPVARIRWSGERCSPPPPAPPQYSDLSQYLVSRRSSGDSLSTNSSGDTKSGNQLLESEYANTSSGQQRPPAVVSIKVKRTMSQSVPNSMVEVREDVTRQKMCQSFHALPDRASDYSDRENTPTGDDDLGQISRSPIGGIPVAPMVATKLKAIALIVAKSKQSSREGSPDVILDIEKHEAERNNDGYKSPVKNLEGFKYPLASNGSLKRTSDNIYDSPQLGPPRTVVNYVNYPPMAAQQIMSSPFSPLHVLTQFPYTSGSPRGSQQNSPGGISKKAPPPPPKRTASISSGDNFNKNLSSITGLDATRLNATPSSGPLTSVLSLTPIYNKSPMSSISVPQSQAFVSCVQSLSERFGKKSEENGAGDNVCSDSEELPAAPPVAMEIIEPKISNYGLLGKSDKTSSGEYMLQQRLKRDSSSSASASNPSVENAFGVKLRQAKTESQNQSNETIVMESQSIAVSNVMSQSNVAQDYKNVVNSQSNIQTSVPQNVLVNVQTECARQTKETCVIASETEKQRKDSSGSEKGNDLSSSTSSLDSNTLPFANENVGTIKQRVQQGKPSLVMILNDGTLAAPVHEADDSAFHYENTDAIKKMPNKFPNPLQPVVQILQQQFPPHQLATQQQFHLQQFPQHLPSQQQFHPQQFSQHLPSQQQFQQQQFPQNLPSDQHFQQQNSSQQLTSQQQIQHQQRSQQPHYNASVTASFVPGSQPFSPGAIRPPLQQTSVSKPTVSPKPAVSPKHLLKGQNGTASSKQSDDVLSEIDNMLQGLTDELDAMLDSDLAE